MVNRYIQIILLILLSLPGISQDKSLSDIIFSIAEDLASDETNPEAAEQFIEQLNALYEDPVKINSADETDLSLLFFLTDFQIKAIIDYIKISGRIVSVYEISAIPGFDRGIVEMMIPFITLDSENKNSHDKMILNNTLLTNLIFKPGAKDTSHLGSHLKILTRYKFTAGRLSAGFTTDI
jgi:tRNA uridine 5-carbamoylmethylation protein Kti12